MVQLRTGTVVRNRGKRRLDGLGVLGSELNNRALAEGWRAVVFEGGRKADKVPHPDYVRERVARKQNAQREERGRGQLVPVQELCGGGGEEGSVS